MYTARGIESIVRTRLDGSPVDGHGVEMSSDGSLSSAFGRQGGLVYLIDFDLKTQWFEVPGRGAAGPDLGEVDVSEDLGGLLRRLEAFGEGPALDAAGAIRDLVGAEASRLADECLVSWDCREALAFAAAGKAVQAAVRAALPTAGMRSRLERLDPLGWAMSFVPPGREVHPARLRRMLADGRIVDVGLFRMLLGVPEDWYPAGEAEWDAAKALARVLAGEGPLEMPVADMLGSFDFLDGVRGRWAGYMARSFPDPAAARDAVQDAVDMAVHFASRVVAPALFRHGLGDCGYAPRADSPMTLVAAGILFGRKGLPAIVETSRRWHAAIPPEESRPDAWRPGWPVPFGPLDAPGGLRLVCLSSPGQLSDEGRAMRHCVWSYDDACSTGRSVVVSVRDQAGQRVSTVELRRREAGFAMAQHRGVRNAAPPEDAGRAVGWMLAALESGEIAVSSRYTKHKWVRHASSGRPYDAMDDAAFAKEAGAWTRYLPRPLRESRALEAEVVREAVRLTETRYFGRPHDAIGYSGLLDARGVPTRPPAPGDRGPSGFQFYGAWAFFRSAFRRSGCGFMLDEMALLTACMAAGALIAVPKLMIDRLGLEMQESLAYSVAAWGALLFVLHLRNLDGPGMRRYARWRRRADEALARTLQPPVVRTPRPEPDWRRIGWGPPQAASRS